MLQAYHPRRYRRLRAMIAQSVTIYDKRQSHMYHPIATCRHNPQKYNDIVGDLRLYRTISSEHVFHN